MVSTERNRPYAPCDPDAYDRLRLRQLRLLVPADRRVTDPFTEIIGADLQRRRDQLDQLDPGERVADRAGVMVLHDDGCAEAIVILAGPDGPVRHSRTLPAAAVAALAGAQPPRWRGAQQLTTSRAPSQPARALLDWDLAAAIRHETDEVPWATLLISDQPPAGP